MAVLQETKTKVHPSYTIAYRILAYLRETKPKTFVSADIAKALGMTPCEVGSTLRFVPGARVVRRGGHGRKHCGHLWVFEEPGWQ